MTNTNICIVRTSFYDRSPLLRLSLDYQNTTHLNDNFDTWFFLDPHPEYGVDSSYDTLLSNYQYRIDWPEHVGKYCWYKAVEYIFEHTSYEYVISIEDDIIISKDYLKLCHQLTLDNNLLNQMNNNILYFHIGAWQKPRGNPNKIVRSSACSRSILIHRSKFDIIRQWQQNHEIDDNDQMISSLLNHHKMTTIAPEMNRHGHFGIYGWSSNGVHMDIRGQKAVFEHGIDKNDLYTLLQQNCTVGAKLLELNQYKNPEYFWDFDVNIDFDNLFYEI